MTTPVRLPRKQASFGFHDLGVSLRFCIWLLLPFLAAGVGSQGLAGGFLDDLTQPQEGTSRRVTSAMRVGELRPGSRDREVNPAADPKGDLEEASNFERLECVGKAPQSAGYFRGIESVRLRERRPRVTTMAHDRHKDWRVERKLYR